MSSTGAAATAGSGRAGSAKPVATRCASVTSMFNKWPTMVWRMFSVATFESSNTKADAKWACSCAF